jgi:hypothetical protein
MGSHDTSQAAFVGHGQGVISQLLGAERELFGVRRTGQEGEVGFAVQLGVSHAASLF